jgi:hypothetical protein
MPTRILRAYLRKWNSSLTCPNQKIIPIGGQCFSCIYPCAECSKDPSQCFSCLSGFYLSNEDCVRNCPIGTRPVNGVCSCSSGLFLDGSCVSACPSGFTRVGNDCRRCYLNHFFVRFYGFWLEFRLNFKIKRRQINESQNSIILVEEPNRSQKYFTF